MFNSLYSSTNQELVEKHLCNQGSCYEKKQKVSVMQTKHVTTKLKVIAVSKDEWAIPCKIN